MKYNSNHKNKKFFHKINTKKNKILLNELICCFIENILDIVKFFIKIFNN